ncbi:uncharacterized protein LOC122320481 [Drosophila ficusphila]|uniref:uncharacterized protein LOC122320481 n=1 Tax=Drosophila ficusphila TaxID=30025 RepID=UPI001C896040|nr:uncharacterized protein LOC122320481 [Drosophila ficusphila]
MSAYGACVYIVSRSADKANAQLLCSKSRVAPLKTLSIPKLELCGALLLANLLSKLQKMDIFSGPYFCWCDSTVVLAWLNSESSRFTTFVANRVASIQRLSAGMEWLHIPTALNPADIISRGALPMELNASDLWFHGPLFLLLPRSSWPPSPAQEQCILELRKATCLVLTSPIDLTSNCKSPTLTVSDLQNGTRLLVRVVQRATMWADLKAIQANHVLKSSNCLSSLSPFVDDFGLLRVGGRLSNSSLPFDSRHPMILPRKHPVTSAIIKHFHKESLHAGPRTVLARIRLHYWPIGGEEQSLL